MATHIIGTTALATSRAGGSTGDALTPSPAGGAASDSTETTPGNETSRQDWLDILLSIAEKLDLPLSKINLHDQGKVVLCIMLPGVRQVNGELVID